jgi:hypothetical protein
MQQVRDAPQVLVRERLEDDDLVDAVDELGLNVFFTSPSTMSVTDFWILARVGRLEAHRRLLLMKRAPMFDVMMTIVFLKLTRLPSPSVRCPSSKTCSRMLKRSGCAFSISSSSTTE